MYLVSHLEMFACNLLGINMGLGINEPLSPLTYLPTYDTCFVRVCYVLQEKSKVNVVRQYNVAMGMST